MKKKKKDILKRLLGRGLKHKNKIIERQLRFQDLLISISTKYINADLSNIDKLIGDSLRQIGEFVKCDRSYIFSYDLENNTCSNTYEWCAEGIDSEIDNLQDMPLDYLSEWFDVHKKGLPFYVEDVSRLPKDGPLGLRAILEPQGIQSLLTIPKIKNDQLIGFIGFDSVRKVNTYTDNEKNILFVFANMLVNILRRKENEELIKQQKRKKEELLKSLSLQNQALNEYTQVISHDLKAPLINIHTIIEWFLSDYNDGMCENAEESLKQVLFNVEKMDNLIKGILNNATANKLESDSALVNFNKIIDEVLKPILIPNHIKITVQDNLPSLLGNERQYKQVFAHLIENAINAIDKENGIINVGFTEKESCFEFFVKDNGTGIKPDYFDKIFKIYTKLDCTKSSSGIGLSIVKKIITFYNGSIWLESQEGIGSVFYFTLLKE